MGHISARVTAKEMIEIMPTDNMKRLKVHLMKELPGKVSLVDKLLAGGELRMKVRDEKEVSRDGGRLRVDP